MFIKHKTVLPIIIIKPITRDSSRIKEMIIIVIVKLNVSKYKDSLTI
uniref:Uncharacterized protein n=1 Tax=Bostrychia simpliciuscula TaxID=324754 RepID=A0A1Z1M7F3_9FLOR|nr:hypothetical protein [Bostrychia simpliciuscula]ARW62018.1 hypothetical protein [Bostrychia simpliciuscula]